MNGDAPVMHAALLDNPFRATVCGEVEGWRTQIASDVNCPDCLADPRVIAPAEGHSSAGTGHDDLTAEEQYRAMGRDYPPAATHDRSAS